MDTALHIVFWGAFALAFLRASAWTAYDGVGRTAATATLWLIGVALVIFTETEPLLLAALSLVALFLVARSPTEVLFRRVDREVSRLSEGLGLDIESGIIPRDQLGQMMAAAGAEDADASDDVVNAYASRYEGKHLVMLTPAAARLPDNEMQFIIAHELGHHVLGHTDDGLLAKMWRLLQSPSTILFTMGGGFLLGAPIAALLAGGALFKIFGRQMSQDDELGADAWAVARLRDLGLDPSGGQKLMEQFEGLYGGNKLLAVLNAVFGTHPEPSIRKARVVAALTEANGEPAGWGR